MTNKINRQIFCTIAGSDSGGGAGIQADIKTAESLGLFATSIVTAITAQNPEEVTGIMAVEPRLITKQLEAVFSYFKPQAWKSGMITGEKTIESLTDFFININRFNYNMHSRNDKKSALEDVSIQKLELSTKRQPSDLFYILDPVMIATSGVRLISDIDVGLIKNQLLGLCSLATPNIHEATFLTGVEIHNYTDQKDAARVFFETYGCSVLIKGGHMKADDGQCVDVFYDGSDYLDLSGLYIPGIDSHGSGCSYSAAIASYLALGLDTQQALEKSRTYMYNLFQNAWSNDQLPMSNEKDGNKYFLNHQF